MDQRRRNTARTLSPAPAPQKRWHFPARSRSFLPQVLRRLDFHQPPQRQHVAGDIRFVPVLPSFEDGQNQLAFELGHGFSPCRTGSGTLIVNVSPASAPTTPCTHGLLGRTRTALDTA